MAKKQETSAQKMNRVAKEHLKNLEAIPKKNAPKSLETQKKNIREFIKDK